MIEPEFLAMLACPATRQPLREATAAELAALNAAAARGALRNRGGAQVPGPLPAALASADGAWFYPIRDGIPRLLIAEAIASVRATDGAGR